MQTITFDQSAKDFVLKTFNKTINNEGVLVEVNNPKQPVLTTDGEEIKGDQFAGIRSGSEIYIKSDLPSLIKLYDGLPSK